MRACGSAALRQRGSAARAAHGDEQLQRLDEGEDHVQLAADLLELLELVDLVSARAHPLVQHGLAPNCFSRTSPQNYTTINKICGPKVHIPTLNHIGLWVDDIHAAVSELTEAGVRFAPGGIRPGAAGHDVTFIHPKGSADRPLSGEGGWNRNKRQ